MSVIVEFSLPDDEFELARILPIDDGASVTLETIVPTDDQAIPLVRLHDASREAFEESLRANPGIDDLSIVEDTGSETLYALSWDSTRDAFVQGVREANATILEGFGTPETWTFRLRLPSHGALEAFREYCNDAGIRYTFERIASPTDPDTDPWYGLTQPQREALLRAVEEGYYAIPRRISTQELADELGISDQAVTERLRRAIVTLVTNTRPQAEQK
jgi:predicted DNA binding protein